MSRIRIGVIGVGRMGQHHCRVYSSLRQVDFVGVYDTNLSLSRDVANRYEIFPYDQIDALLDQVDAVTIASPTPTHFELATRCIDHGVNVLLEKPITETLEQAEELLMAVNKSGLVLQIGHIERFNPTYQELKNVMDNLNVLAINFRRLSPYLGSNKDVDVVMDLMIHDIDLVLDLTQREPDSISAYGLNPLSGALDYVVAEFWYKEGQLITLTASRVTEQKIRSVEVTAQEAYLEADFLNKGIYVHRRSVGEYLSHNQGSVKYRQESIIERIVVPNIEPLLLEIQHFLQCISNHCIPCVSALDGLLALRTAYKICSMTNKQRCQ